MTDDEFYYCAECEDDDPCECGGGFYAHDEDDVEVECPCCGSMNVQP